MRLRTKTLITFLPLVVIPLLILGGVSVVKLKNAEYHSVMTERANFLKQLLKTTIGIVSEQRILIVYRLAR